MLTEALRRLEVAWDRQPSTWAARRNQARHVWNRIARRAGLRPARTWMLDGSRAFFRAPNAGLCGAVRVNVAGREPDGVVEPGPEYDELCSALTAEFQSWVNGANGEPVVRRVMRSAELYEGPAVDQMPDLLIEWHQEHPIDAIASPTIGLIDGPYAGHRTGDHRRDGFLVRRGPAAADEASTVMDARARTRGSRCTRGVVRAARHSHVLTQRAIASDQWRMLHRSATGRRRGTALPGEERMGIACRIGAGRRGYGEDAVIRDFACAVAAAMSIASALDLTVDDATVLHNSNKLALRLLPCDVVARVAHVGQEVARFEVDLARRLAGTESPVAALEPRVEPRAYERDGFVVTLWTYYESVAPPEASPADYAHALERLHAGMRKVDVTSAALHGSSRGGSTARREPRPHSGARRRGPGASQQHVAKPETSDQRPRRRRAAAARRAAPGKRAQHEERVAVHRPRDVLPSGRSSSTSPMCPKRSASSTRTLIKNCSASAGSSSSRWSQRGAGIHATNSRTGNEPRENSSVPSARVHRGRRSTS